MIRRICIASLSHCWLGCRNTKVTSLILVAVLELVAEICFFAPRAFSQAPTPTYQQTASLDDNTITGGVSTIGSFPPTGQFTGLLTAAQTDIGFLNTTDINGIQTEDGTSLSQVLTTTTTTSSTASASTKADYFVEVNSSVSPFVTLNLLGTLTGSVGTAQGDAFTFVGFDEAEVVHYDTSDTSTGSYNNSLNFTVNVPTNLPQEIELVTSATLSGGFGTVTAQIDPYVQIDPNKNPDPSQYKLTFLTSPVPEPASHALSIGGLVFLLAVFSYRRFLLV
jgi:hypothetical protein